MNQSKPGVVIGCSMFRLDSAYFLLCRAIQLIMIIRKVITLITFLATFTIDSTSHSHEPYYRILIECALQYKSTVQRSLYKIRLYPAKQEETIRTENDYRGFLHGLLSYIIGLHRQITG